MTLGGLSSIYGGVGQMGNGKTYGPSRDAYANEIKDTLTANIISYLPLWETSGIYADGYVGTSGVCTNVGITQAEAGIGDGRTSYKFDGTSGGVINWYGAALASAFNGAEGSFNIWVKVLDAGVWTDGAEHAILKITYNTSNNLYIAKKSTNGRIEFLYVAGGSQKQYRLESQSTTDWMMLTITWSKTAEQCKVYVNSVLKYTGTTLGTWTGTPAYNVCAIGAMGDTGAGAWKGWLAHALLMDRALSQEEVTELYSLPAAFGDSVPHGSSMKTVQVADGASIVDAIATMRGGDTLSLATNGTYIYTSETVDDPAEFINTPSGNAAFPTKVEGNNASVKSKCYSLALAGKSYIDISNVNFREAQYWSAFLENCNNINFTDCTFYNPSSGSAYDCVRFEKDTYITLTRCTATSTTNVDNPRAHDGFEIWGPASHFVFTDCAAYNIKNGPTDNEGHGFEVYGQLAGQVVDDVQYINCESYNCQVGFSVEGGPLSLSHTNIVCDGCSSHDNAFYGYQGVDGSTLYRQNVAGHDNTDNAVSETYGSVTDI